MTRFGKILPLYQHLKLNGNFTRHLSVFGKKLNPLWQVFHAIGQIFIVENGKIIPPSGLTGLSNKPWQLNSFGQPQVVFVIIKPFPVIQEPSALEKFRQTCKKEATLHHRDGMHEAGVKPQHL